MAQISKGIRVGYAKLGTGGARPSSYEFIPQLTGIPALGGAPSTHQVTTLDDETHVYTKGLTDVGGNLDFPCIFTKDIIDKVESAISLQEGNVVEWAIEFPSPLGRRAYFNGEAVPVYNESTDVDAPVLGSLSLVPNGVVKWEQALYTVTFDENGGSVVGPQDVLYGASPEEPTPPTRNDYVFIGWFTDDGTFENKVEFGRFQIKGDITLYAKWENE